MTRGTRLARAGLFPGARVLDTGCGTGGLLAELVRARSDLSLEGLELDEGAAKVAREKTGLVITVGSVDRMPYAAGSFSGIVTADVLYHSGVDELAALTEFRHCLSPRGLLLLNLPAYECLRSTHDVSVHTARRYHARQAEAIVRGAGSSRVHVSYWNSFLFLLMLVHRFATARRGDGASDVRKYPPWQNRLLLSILEGEHRLSSLGFRLPSGGSVQIEARK